jgi:hypothetical protein
MSADLTKRIMVRVTDEQLAWIGEMATDEGMDNATFVRVVIDRLSKGRAPLIVMMQTQSFAPAGLNAVPEWPRLSPQLQRMQEENDGVATDILSQRAAEAEAALPEHSEDAESAPQENAAIPLRRVPRERYNPGRQ